MKSPPNKKISLDHTKNAHSATSRQTFSTASDLNNQTPRPKDLSAYLPNESRGFDMSNNTAPKAQQARNEACNARENNLQTDALISQGWKAHYDELDAESPLIYLSQATEQDKYFTAQITRDVNERGEADEPHYTLYIELGGLHEVEVLWAYANKAIEWFNWVAPVDYSEIYSLPPVDRNMLTSFSAGRADNLQIGLGARTGKGECIFVVESAPLAELHEKLLWLRTFFAAAGGER